MRFWTCCGQKLPRVKQKCPECGKSRPKRPTAAQKALSDPYEWWTARFGETCGICGAESSGRRRLDRDHEHKTGKSRGLLCSRCNRNLPYFATAEWAWSAWRYLVRHELMTQERLAWNVEDRGYDTPCWTWQRALHSAGYGVIRWDADTLLYVHRLMYRGPIPKGMHVDHLCRNRACCNPDHLEVVTCAENLRRGKVAKVNPQIVAEIRLRRSLGETTVALGKEYGIHSSQVSRIARGLQWGDAA